MGGEEAGRGRQVVVAAQDDLPAGSVVAGRQRGADAVTSRLLDEAQRQAVGVRVDHVAAAVDVAVEDDDDLPRLRHRLGSERVEQEREARGAAPGGHQDGQGGSAHVAAFGASARAASTSATNSATSSSPATGPPAR